MNFQNLEILSFKKNENPEDVSCQACALFSIHLSNIKTDKEKIHTAYAWTGKDKMKSKMYLIFEVLDIDTGELHEFNCRADVNEMMIKHKYYPKPLQDAFEKYKQKYRK